VASFRRRVLSSIVELANDRANSTSLAAGRDALWVVEWSAAGGGLKLYAESWIFTEAGWAQAVV
jgi:hypothetical protein